jgi:hypothetical protein
VPASKLRLAGHLYSVAGPIAVPLWKLNTTSSWADSAWDVNPATVANGGITLGTNVTDGTIPCRCRRLPDGRVVWGGQLIYTGVVGGPSLGAVTLCTVPLAFQSSAISRLFYCVAGILGGPPSRCRWTRQGTSSRTTWVDAGREHLVRLGSDLIHDGLTVPAKCTSCSRVGLFRLTSAA